MWHSQGSAWNFPSTLNHLSKPARLLPEPATPQSEMSIFTVTSEPIQTPEELSKRTLANRRNALKSTGPRTAAGKHRVAMNAFKHGLSGQNLCLQADESVSYFRLALDFVEDLRPIGVREEQLAQKIIDGNWRLNRAAAIENNLLNNDTVRETYRLTSDDPRSAALAGQANAWRSDCAGPHALETLGRHEGRMARTLFKTTAEFDTLQARRLKREDKDTFVKHESRAWRFLNDALTHYRAEETARAEAEAEAEAEAAAAPVPEPEIPEPLTKQATCEMALNWQTDPAPAFYPTRSMTRNQELRRYAASIGMPFPVFTEDDLEDNLNEQSS